jgi:hypothetical protein
MVHSNVGVEAVVEAVNSYSKVKGENGGYVAA